MTTTWKPIGMRSFAHSSDLKACAKVDVDKVVTAGRDGLVKLWQLTDGECEELISYEEHEGFVNSVAFIPSTNEYPDGIIVSGGKDKLINLWDYAGKRLCGTLIGHDDNICKLSSFSNESAPFVMASSSWDGNVRCWSEELSPVSCLVLKVSGSGPCWSCASLERDCFVTGHADKSIRIWRGDCQVQVIENAHWDVVRDVLCITGQGCFLSVGNDGAIKVWDSSSGKVIQTINSAHPAFIYGIAWNGKDRIASFGEEGIVKVWKWSNDSKRIEEETILRVPMTSAWCATFLNESNLIVGGSTGSIYVFSSSGIEQSGIEEAFLSELRAFDEQVRASKSTELEKNAQDESVLKYPGERIGKTILVRKGNNNLIEAHQWDGAEWKYLGEAIDPLAVKAPDFTFKVDLDDSGKTYNLSYSFGENPYSVAKNFLEINEMPISYLDEVANFITKNTGGAENISAIEDNSEDDLREPDAFLIEACNEEGILSKLKSFGMEIEIESGSMIIGDALRTWPVNKLYPCLDWLRVQVLKGEDYDNLLSVIPYEKILQECCTDDSSEKEKVAAVTMTLRVLCNATGKGKANLLTGKVDLIKFIGKCSSVNNNKNWIPLLIGLLFNQRREIEFGKLMALLHNLITRIDFELSSAEISRIFWTIKSGSVGGAAVPLAAAFKKEIEGKPQLKCLLKLLN